MRGPIPALCVLAALVSLGLSQPAVPPVPSAAVAPPGNPIARAETTLSNLNPGRPSEYLRAGELLIEREATREVGRQALALAILLSAENDPALGASAAVALASVAPTEDERTGLWSVAVGLDPSRRDDRLWLPAGPADAAASDALAARVLGGLRTNDPEAVALLGDRPELRERIFAEGERLRHDGARVRAVLASWLRNAENDPCRGRMTMRVREGGGFVQTPCPSPHLHHGAVISEDWRMMVGIELALLGATPSSWPAQAAVGLDAGISVWTPERIAEAYAVSADRPLRRNGRWVAR